MKQPWKHFLHNFFEKLKENLRQLKKKEEVIRGENMSPNDQVVKT